MVLRFALRELFRTFVDLGWGKARSQFSQNGSGSAYSRRRTSLEFDKGLKWGLGKRPNPLSDFDTGW